MMTTRNPICSVLNRWADETARAEDAAGNNFYKRRQAVRALGRIHYVIWIEDLHTKTDITFGDCFWCAIGYGVELLHDILTYPLKRVVCKRR